MTYRDLIAGAKEYAAALQDQSINSGEVVIIILKHSLHLIFSYFRVALYGFILWRISQLTTKPWICLNIFHSCRRKCIIRNYDFRR